MKRKYYLFILPITWCLIIYAFTASPSSTGSNTQSIFQHLFGLNDEYAQIVNYLIRKATHVSVFGILAILFSIAFGNKKFVLCWLLTTVYAATDEFHQLIVPNRTGSITDVMLDSFGAALALLALRYLAKRKYPK